MRRWKILHLITGLGTGGAEGMLYKLLATVDRARFDFSVMSLMRAGPLSAHIERLAIPVRSLGVRRGIPDPRALVRVANEFRDNRPHLVQTWLAHADLLGGISGAFAGIPVVWNFRHAELDRASTSRLTRITERTCAGLSRWLPRKVICCSRASSRYAADLGFETSKLLVIPNGFDLKVFKPDAPARLSVRDELGLARDSVLVGLVARHDPNKDHGTFLQAAARVHRAQPDVHFLLCGDGVVPGNPALASWVRSGSLGGVVHLLGPRADMPRIQAALDVACSSSTGEGFPNVVGEAMASGVPCVVTDVGESAEIVRETGRIVRPRDPFAFAQAVLELVALDPLGRKRLGELARERVRRQYPIEAIAQRYESLYEQVIGELAA